MPTSTYYTYNEGVDSRHLHLGNLVHEYKNPNDYEPFIENTYIDVSEPAPEWAQSASLENFAMILGTSPSQSSDEAGTQHYRVVAAEKTTRLEIDDPEEFFKTHTLISPTAKKWLSSHLSAAEAITKGSGPRPQIWMLTGLILMQHATWSLVSSSSKNKFAPGERAPFNSTGVATIRRASVSDGVKPTFGHRANGEERVLEGGHVIHETGKYPGTRAWAAQWTKVEVEMLDGERLGEAENIIRLRPFDEKGSKVAKVVLDEDEYAVKGENEEKEEEDDFDEKFWDAFLEATDE